MAKTYSDKLQKIQNRARRAVMSVDWKFPSEALFRLIQTKFNESIDRLCERRDKQLVYVMYKIVNGNMPTNITNIFSYRQYLCGLRKTTLRL